jgi:PAS domain S-box-containing protein
MEDKDERLRAEEALKMSEERFRKIIEVSPIGITTCDPNFRLTSANEAFCRMTGYSEEELLSLTFLDITHPEYREENVINLGKLSRGGISEYSTEKRYIRKDGSVFWGSVIVTAIRDNAGRMIHTLAMIENINDRKVAEEEIRKWKDHYEVVSITSGQAVYDYHLASGIIKWGGETEKVLGYTSDEIGHIDRWAELIHPDEKEKVLEILDNQIRTQSVLNVRYRFLHKAGHYLYVHDKAHIVRNSSNEPESLVGMMQDITDIVMAGRVLAAKEQQYRTLFEVSPSGISLQDLQGNILDVNDSYCRMTGFSREELIGKNVRMLVPKGKHYHDVADNINRIIRGKILEHEVINLNKAGKLLFIELKDTLFRLPDGSDGILTVSNNITGRKHAEQFLKESQEKLKVFAEHLQTIREEERVEIARELHDNLGQHLSAIKMDLCMLIKKLSEIQCEDEKVPGIIGQAKDMIPMIEQTIDMVRKISSELRPVLLDELGLIPAIERYLEEFGKRGGIECSLVLGVRNIKVDRNHAVGIFRILQEACTNILRHAEATRVEVRIMKDKKSVILEIGDNGIGMRKSKIDNIRSLGILGMRERAMLFGGELQITSKKGQGTKVSVEIPLKRSR